MDDYDYSMDAYWTDVDLTEKQMDLIDQLSRFREDLYELILVVGARTEGAEEKFAKIIE